ncbi:phosphoribosyl-ATP pyrophosphohydrolase [Halobacillus halophilus]|uniref:nucleoside triphosphate pyrophosphohydrolase n=1 Tax=Halobacillus halophilus TaxID=1570 RepID=UPI00136BBC3D|nr:nucleoside triphosphate pyrophosphohydrolase [Halobacillus halophilus]MYL30483.1 phosphoribosyl-ATP pyrophosphohydrolase [Halobacillus halophilus]
MDQKNRLVRDYTPMRLEDSGKTIRTRQLEGQEYKETLTKKLLEVVDGYSSTKENRESLTRLADMMEVIHELTYTHGATIEEIEHIRQHRRKERGGFKNRTLLIEVEE